MLGNSVGSSSIQDMLAVGSHAVAANIQDGNEFGCLAEKKVTRIDGLARVGIHTSFASSVEFES